MSTHAIHVPTPFTDIVELAESFAQRVDPERLMLPHHEAVPEGEWVQFTVTFADGSGALVGVGRCTGSYDSHESGEERAPEHRFDVVMDALELDEVGQSHFEHVLMARAAQMAAEGPAGEEPVEGYDAGGHDAGGYDAGGYDAGGYDAHGYDAGGHDAGGHDAGDHDAGYEGAGVSADAASFQQVSAEAYAPVEDVFDVADVSSAASEPAYPDYAQPYPEDAPLAGPEVQAGHVEAAPAALDTPLDEAAYPVESFASLEPGQEAGSHHAAYDVGSLASEHGAPPSFADDALAAEPPSYDAPAHEHTSVLSLEDLAEGRYGAAASVSQLPPRLPQGQRLAPPVHAIYALPAPVAPGALPTPHAYGPTPRRRTFAASWAPQPELRPEPSPSSGLFQYGDHGLPRPAQPPRPAMDPGLRVLRAPRSGDPLALPGMTSMAAASAAVAVAAEAYEPGPEGVYAPLAQHVDEGEYLDASEHVAGHDELGYADVGDALAEDDLVAAGDVAFEGEAAFEGELVDLGSSEVLSDEGHVEGYAAADYAAADHGAADHGAADNGAADYGTADYGTDETRQVELPDGDERR